MKGDKEKCLAAGMDDYLAKPIRIQDLGAILERWATILSSPQSQPSDAVPPIPPPPEPPTPPAPATPWFAEPSKPPVDTERLLEVTSSQPDRLRELTRLFLDQTGAQLTRLETAIRSSDAPEVRQLAHACASASAACGVDRLLLLLRGLEAEAAEARLDDAPALYEVIAAEFKTVRDFLDTYVPQQIVSRTLPDGGLGTRANPLPQD